MKRLSKPLFCQNDEGPPAQTLPIPNPSPSSNPRRMSNTVEVFAFLCEYFDQNAQLVKRFRLNYFADGKPCPKRGLTDFGLEGGLSCWGLTSATSPNISTSFGLNLSLQPLCQLPLLVIVVIPPQFLLSHLTHLHLLRPPPFRHCGNPQPRAHQDHNEAHPIQRSFPRYAVRRLRRHNLLPAISHH